MKEHPELKNQIYNAETIKEQECLIEIYHGSENIIEKPEFGKGKVKNDFGLGFYCSPYEELAKEWAASLNGVGYSNKYILNTAGLKIVNLNDDKYTLLNWLALLLKHRDFTPTTYESKANREYILQNFYPNIENADIIIGYRADDSYFSWAKDFLHDQITYEQLEKAMHIGFLGDQIVLKSKRSFEQISFIGYEEVIGVQYYNLKHGREKRANNEYFHLKMSPNDERDLKASDIRKDGLTNEEFRVSRNVCR